MLAHFDNWQREGHDDDYEAQDQWPVELRRARLVPAVDYVQVMYQPYQNTLTILIHWIRASLSLLWSSNEQAQRARGRLIREVRESFTVDAFIGNVTDWELVCLGNLVGMPIVVVPTGFKSIEHPPKGNTRRRTTVTTGIYAPPDHDHIVSFHIPRHLSKITSSYQETLVTQGTVVMTYVCLFRLQALALAMAYQSVTDHHKQRPPIDAN